MIRTPACLGHMESGKVYEVRNCDDCPDYQGCWELSNKVPEKKPLDPRWADELIDYAIGPYLVIIGVKTPTIRSAMVEILRNAITDLYKQGAYQTTEEWVASAWRRVSELYQLYATSRLTRMMDDGVPAPTSIIRPH